MNPVIGVVCHSFLKEQAILDAKQECQIALIAPAYSPLHAIADFSIPVDNLDMTEEELMHAVLDAQKRQIPISGLVAWRDTNVPTVLAVAHKLGFAASPLSVLDKVCSKFHFREWLNGAIHLDCHEKLPTALVQSDCNRAQFDAIVLPMMQNHKEIIVKPSNGSCSVGILHLASPEDVDNAFSVVQSMSTYRGGSFVAEAKATGTEFSVETIVDSDGQVQHVLITDYLPHEQGHEFNELGFFAPSVLPQNVQENVTLLSTAIHSAMGLCGIVTHMELMYNEKTGKLAVIELNMRPAGGLIPEIHKLASGVNLHQLSARITCKKNMDNAVSVSAKQTVMIRFYPPMQGYMNINKSAYSLLRGPNEKLVQLVPPTTYLSGESTNDDRSMYVLLQGTCCQELKLRSLQIFERVSFKK